MSFADYQCSISGGDGAKVELRNTNLADTDEDGYIYVYLSIKGASKQMSVNVMVYCYDKWGNPYDAKSATVTYIPSGYGSRGMNEGSVRFKVEKGESYTFSVSDAQCR